MSEAAFGFRAHSGWAALVTLVGPIEAPVVIQRQRIDLAGPQTVARPFQPYHAARQMPLEEARPFLDRCAESSAAAAYEGIQAALGEVLRRGYHGAAACILLGSGRPATDLSAVLASHPQLHMADGQFFREALRSACTSCGLPILGVREKDILARSAAAIGITPSEAQRRISEMGKSIGPPWTQDQKLCVLASWLVLARSTDAQPSAES